MPPLSAARGPAYRTPGHEPPEQHPADAQPDEVQEEELHVEGQQRRRDDQGDHRRHDDSPLLPPGPLLRGLSSRVAHRLAVQMGSPTSASSSVITTPAEQPPVWQQVCNRLRARPHVLFRPALCP